MDPNGQVAPLTGSMKNNILASVRDMAQCALRTLALSMKSDLNKLSDYDGADHAEHRMLSNPENFVLVEEGMTFVGLVGLHDPPRPECRSSIESCRTAGVSVIMITGDNKATAEAIAENLGILSNSAENSMTGKEFELLTEPRRLSALKRMVSGRESGGVFSRTEPKHKQIIVKLLKSIGEVPAMTGDGVNDAPALKQADIGIAMGISGTEVAKEASDMILTDDNFATIVYAIEEGRSIYNNMKAFIRYLISSNIGEVASIFFTAALGIPEGLAPVQLLWVNLVTDGPPATALGFNPPDLDVMLREPRRKDDLLISGWVFFRYMVVGLYVGFATVGVFVYWYTSDVNSLDNHPLVSFQQLTNWGKCDTWKDFNLTGEFSTDPCAYFGPGKAKASTLSLTVLVVIEMLNALNALSEDGSLLQMPPWYNPYLLLAMAGSIGIHMMILYIPMLSKIFSVVPLDSHDWYLVMAFSIPVIIIDEFLKLFGRMHTQARQAYVKRHQ